MRGNRDKSWDGSGMAVMIKLLYRRKMPGSRNQMKKSGTVIKS